MGETKLPAGMVDALTFVYSGQSIAPPSPVACVERRDAQWSAALAAVEAERDKLRVELAAAKARVKRIRVAWEDFCDVDECDEEADRAACAIGAALYAKDTP
jgi:hypothetical protein